MVKVIEVYSKGEQHKVLVDDDIAPPGKVHKKGNYFCFKIGKKNIYLHRWIMDVTDSKLQVDHINNDPKNNTRENLRVCTHGQNQQNIKRKGYTFHKHYGKWQAGLKIDGKFKYLGRYDTPEEAQQVYRKAHVEAFGEFSPYYNYYHSNNMEVN